MACGVTVHPHTRGDNTRLHFSPIGSQRFTPTHVGTTLRVVISIVWPTGSPPHTWGQLADSSRRPYRPPVHPHTRGDNVTIHHGDCRTIGSPPHTWGQRAINLLKVLLDKVHPHTRGDNISCWPPRSLRPRFTPTHVGTTRRLSSGSSGLPVHPHTRGDNVFPYGWGWGQSIGSPPHTWGQLRRRSLSRGLLPVHPHTRGDNGSRSPRNGSLSGSPPHTWGQLLHRSFHDSAFGSPPHTWGQHGSAHAPRCSRSVHPHTRGDNGG